MYTPTTEEQTALAFETIMHNIYGMLTSCLHYIITHPATVVAVLICIALLIVCVRVAHAIVHVCKYIIKKLNK